LSYPTSPHRDEALLQAQHAAYTEASIIKAHRVEVSHRVKKVCTIGVVTFTYIPKSITGKSSLASSSYVVVQEFSQVREWDQNDERTFSSALRYCFYLEQNMEGSMSKTIVETWESWS
jgi:hypothetical protein